MVSGEEMCERYLHVNRKDISYIRYIFEGYEGLANATTLDAEKAIVKLAVAPDFVSLVDRILIELHKEIEFSSIAYGEMK